MDTLFGETYAFDGSFLASEGGKSPQGLYNHSKACLSCDIVSLKQARELVLYMWHAPLTACLCHGEEATHLLSKAVSQVLESGEHMSQPWQSSSISIVTEVFIDAE